MLSFSVLFMFAVNLNLLIAFKARFNDLKLPSQFNEFLTVIDKSYKLLQNRY